MTKQGPVSLIEGAVAPELSVITHLAEADEQGGSAALVGVRLGVPEESVGDYSRC